jgi:ATP-binding cassette subfamily F protein uup
MRAQASARRGRQGTARLSLNTAERSGKLVCEAVGVDYAWDGRPIVRDFSTTILRGDRVGIIGPNGCGKSTLLGLLLGRLQPDSGSIERGARLEVAYFDQLRDQLDPQKSVLDNVAGGSDKVTLNGRSKHVISYLGDFLFPPARCRQPVASLSGGERNRLLLAKLFTQPFNLLVLDEPTNDLDLETLDLLEELLLDFDGTLLLVSHDRDFLDHVVTSTLVFEGEGRVGEYVGGYSDWLRQRPRPAEAPGVARAPSASRDKTPPEPRRKTKLSYKEQRELDALPARIEALEATLEGLQSQLSDPSVYEAEGAEGLARLGQQLQSVEQELEACYARWEALEP